MKAGCVAFLMATSSQASAQTAFADLHLTVTAPELAGGQEQAGPAGDLMRFSWTGNLGASEVDMLLYVFPLEDWDFREAGGVTAVMVDKLKKKGEFDVDESFELEGKYGSAPVLSVVSGKVRKDGDAVGLEYAASGLLPAHGYSFHVRMRPEPDEQGKQLMRAFFEKGIAYAGPERDPQWTMEEIEARWKKDAPDELHADFMRNLSKAAWVKNAVVRTEHYLIMTNASGGKKFAQQMEENYQTIGKLFPIPPSKGCRLMPVFLFRTADEYYAFYVRRGTTLEKAKRSAGHASGDYYATWYEAPTDPTHIHEQTHQLFRNRLFLNGGGSWYQEGMAEYVESSRNDRNEIASLVAKGRHLPLVELVQRESLLFSSTVDRKEGGSEAGDLYKQAALLVEFLRDSKWGKDKFPRFLKVFGRVPRSNLEKLRVAFLDVYGIDIEAVDVEFQKYCAAR